MGEEQLFPVDGIDLIVDRGENLCIVGESGSGKSLTALSVMRLIDLEAKAAFEGEIVFEGKNILELDQKSMSAIRGSRIALIPQEPMTALNPVIKIGKQLEQVGLYHRESNKKRSAVATEFRNRAEESLMAVGIIDAKRIMKSYPHQLSGGMRQRVMIAMAVIARPNLIIADEPTTALDVTTQAQILTVIRDLQHQIGVALILITHDLAVAAQIADRIAVMYAGKIVEQASVDKFFDSPTHPYTQGLLNSIPSVDKPNVGRLRSIPGSVPPLNNMPIGCRFAPRCSAVKEQCSTEPILENKPWLTKDHLVACWNGVNKGE